MEAIKAIAIILMVGVPAVALMRAYAVFCVTGEWPHQSKRAARLFREL